MPHHIRAAIPADAPTIVSFNQAMALETEGKELPSTSATPGVAALFAHPERGFYLVAESDGRVLGSLMVTTEWSDWRNGTFWWVQSVYERPEARRQGIYRSLYEQVRREAVGTSGVCGIRLYVERDNKGAQRVYETLGMEPTNYRLYEELL